MGYGENGKELDDKSGEMVEDTAVMQGIIPQGLTKKVYCVTLQSGTQTPRAL